ncbi:hypothetical protein G3M48_001780 [Beauveria asiatica]|uniref:Uncharacterized protein n=1 Tax=Beauveria asiatica TaxID=1069075 RepID=A0AAW0RFG7_9HYPO
MTCGQSNFAAFHWLPEEDPANIIEISSDDEKEIAQTALPHPEQVETTPEDPEPSTAAAAAAAAEAKAAAFRRTIRTSIPIHFLNDAVRLRIRATAICMLETAMSSGTTLDAVYIDDNCLPAWPGRVWDPEDQSLHEVIQSRLAECLDAQELGRSLSAAIIEIGNWRLQEAVALGLQLQDLTIGENLLPTWPGRDGGNSSSSSSSSSDGDAAASDNETMMEIGSSVHSNDLPPPPQPTSQAAAHQCHPTSAWSSDTDSTYDSESEHPTSDYDDEVSLFNFVSQNLMVDDEGDADAPLSNVVHGVDVHGGPPFFEAAGDPVDFEVYAAVDDPDVEQLPEAELVIDEEAFAHHHHHLADVVEIELADGDIYCVVPEEIRSAGGAELREAPGEAEEAHALEEVMTVPGEGEAQASADWVVI